MWSIALLCTSSTVQIFLSVNAASTKVWEEDYLYMILLVSVEIKNGTFVENKALDQDKLGGGSECE